IIAWKPLVEFFCVFWVFVHTLTLHLNLVASSLYPHKSISYYWKSVTLNTQDNWTEYSFVFKTPPKNAFMAIYFKIGKDVSNGEMFWDDVSITEATKPEEYLTIKPLKSSVFFKKDNKFISNYIFNKDIKDFRNVLPSDITLDISVNNIEKNNSVLIYEFKKKYSSEVLTHKYYNINLPKQNILIDPQIATLPLGHYVATLKLQTGTEKNAKIIAQSKKEFSVIKHYDFPVLEPIKEVSINGTSLEVNSKPFIPVCFYHPSLTQNYFEKMKEFGENVKQVWSDIPGGAQANIDNLKGILDLCLKNNSYAFVVMQSHWILDNKKGKYNLNNIRKMVHALKGHPAVLLWSITDEPDARKIPPEEVAKAYKLIKQLDPKHPIWVNLCIPNKFKEYASSTEIASYDHYPNPYETLNTVYKWNNLIIQASKTKKPWFSILQTFSRPGTKLPSYQWLKAQTYLCITQGMKMFFYYAFRDPEPTGSLSIDSELQSQVKELNYEIMSQAKIIIAKPCDISEISGLHNEGIHYSLRKVNGVKYLITVNPYPNKIKCKFSLPESEGNERAEVLFEDGRFMKQTANKVIDDFAPYEVHIYKY
ncbi:MAG: glycoside hydrolase family 2 TIM barrel-domain containing protein, partial [Lentisphaeria bacterium]